MSDVPLRDYVDQLNSERRGQLDTLERWFTAELNSKILGAQREIDQRFGEMRASISAATGELNARLATMNEFRAALTDRERSFVSREVVDQMVQALRDQNRLQEDRIRELERLAAASGGAHEGEEATRSFSQRESGNRLVLLGAVLTAVVIIVNIVIVLATHGKF